MLPVHAQPTKGRLSMCRSSNQSGSALPGIFAVRMTDTKTGAWRQQRPIVMVDKCIGCGICAKYCPAGIILNERPAHIDYDYCKGCGICATVCPKEAIQIVEEEGEGD